MKLVAKCRLALCACLVTLSGCSGPEHKPVVRPPHRPDHRHGLQVYNAYCADCHEAGTRGAPSIHDFQEWNLRSLGFPALLQDHATKGFLSMPAKGGEPALTDDGVVDAVVYMVRRIAIEEEAE